MRFVLLILVTFSVQGETQSGNPCRHCEEESSETGRLAPTCAEGQTKESCRWIVRYERTSAARMAKTQDQADVEAALGGVNLAQPVQIRGEEASALISGTATEFKVVYARKGADGWRIVKIIDVPASQSRVSLQQK